VHSGPAQAEFSIINTQLSAVPFPVRGGLWPEIEHYIEHGPASATDKFGFECGSSLVVHASDSPLAYVKP